MHAALFQDPDWDNQQGQEGQEGHQRRNIMIPCLLKGMNIISNKVVNFDRLHEVT